MTPDGTRSPEWAALVAAAEGFTNPSDRDRAFDLLTDAYSHGVAVGVAREARAAADDPAEQTQPNSLGSGKHTK